MFLKGGRAGIFGDFIIEGPPLGIVVIRKSRRGGWLRLLLRGRSCGGNNISILMYGCSKAKGELSFDHKERDKRTDEKIKGSWIKVSQ